MNIKIRNAGVTLGVNTILEEVNLDINEKDKIAIVGRNGAGKTTLLKAIIDNSLFESGVGDEKFSITTLGKFNIGYLEQIAFSNENNTLIDEVRESFSNLISMENRINNLVAEMNKNNDAKIILEYTETLETFKTLGGYSYQKEYEGLLNKFGFTSEDKLKKIKVFSGGEKTKIAFIKLLLSKPDLLILDEPTNHLDIKTIENLENYLKDYSKTLILVSHDRMFLDNIVNIVYEIDYGKTYKYVGNYSNYEIEKNKRYEKVLKDYEYQQKEIKRLRGIYERFRFKPTKASMALSKLKQIERMDLIEKPRSEDIKTFKTNLSEIRKTSKVVMNLKNLSFGYNTILGSLNLEILRGMKIGIIGENGIGKSTLLKTIGGLIKPLDGKIEYGLNLDIGYFDQNLITLNNDNTVLDEFRNYLPKISYEEARRALGSFLFKNDDVNKKIEVLSGGEKVRLQLCKIFYNKPNVLLLDEPTNHMDIIGKEHLESILKEYTGTLIFITHDRYFVNKIADQLLVFKDDTVKYYPYGYKQYEEEIKKELPLSDNKVKIKKKNVNTYNLNKEIKIIEKDISNKEIELKKLQEELYKEEVFTDYAKSEEINQKIRELSNTLEELNDKWEELMTLMDN